MSPRLSCILMISIAPYVHAGPAWMESQEWYQKLQQGWTKNYNMNPTECANANGEYYNMGHRKWCMLPPSTSSPSPAPAPAVADEPVTWMERLQQGWTKSYSMTEAECVYVNGEYHSWGAKKWCMIPPAPASPSPSPAVADEPVSWMERLQQGWTKSYSMNEAECLSANGEYHDWGFKKWCMMPPANAAPAPTVANDLSWSERLKRGWTKNYEMGKTECRGAGGAFYEPSNWRTFCMLPPPNASPSPSPTVASELASWMDRLEQGWTKSYSMEHDACLSANGEFFDMGWKKWCMLPPGANGAGKNATIFIVLGACVGVALLALLVVKLGGAPKAKQPKAAAAPAKRQNDVDETESERTSESEDGKVDIPAVDVNSSKVETDVVHVVDGEPMKTPPPSPPSMSRPPSAARIARVMPLVVEDLDA